MYIANRFTAKSNRSRRLALPMGPMEKPFFNIVNYIFMACISIYANGLNAGSGSLSNMLTVKHNELNHITSRWKYISRFISFFPPFTFASLRLSHFLPSSLSFSVSAADEGKKATWRKVL